MKAAASLSAGIVLLLTPLIHVGAQIPANLSYQAYLSDETGNPITDGTYSITFSLYDAEIEGMVLWTETKDLEVRQGLFYTYLGDQAAFPDTLRFDRPYWLGIQVDDESEMEPRIPLSSVGYSFTALRADSSQYAVQAGTAQYVINAPSPTGSAGGDLTGEYPDPTISDGVVTGAKIADGSIQRGDVAADFTAPYADTSDYADTSGYALSAPPGGIAGGDLTGEYPDPSIADGVVTGAKIADGTIQRGDVSTDFTAPYADSSDYADTSGYALSAPPGGSAGGDLTGEYPDPTLKPGAVSMDKIDATEAESGMAIMFDGESIGWQTPPNPGGTITGVTAGAGLDGGGTSEDVSIWVAESGITSVMLAADAVAPSAKNADSLGQVEAAEYVTDSELAALSYATAADIMPEVLANDGSGSGLSADSLDGLDASDFAAASHTHSTLAAADGDPAEAVSVDGDGKVGIGTTTPAQKVHVQSSQETFVSSETTSPSFSARFHVKTPDSEGYLGAFTDTYGGDNLDGKVALISWNEVVALKSVNGGLEFFTSATGDPRMTIQTDGDIGIGTTTPAQKVHVQSSQETFVRSETTSPSFSARFHVKTPDSEGYLGAFTDTYEGNNLDGKVALISWNEVVALKSVNGGLEFFTSATGDPRMTIQTDGDIGIGTTDPTSELEVNGTVNTDSLETSGGASIGGTLVVGGGERVNVDSVVTQYYTTKTSDRIILCSADPQYEVMEVTLHPAATAPGQLLNIRLKNFAEGGNVVILPNESSGDTIDGKQDAFIVLSLNSEIPIVGVSLVSDGEDWWSISTTMEPALLID